MSEPRRMGSKRFEWTAVLVTIALVAAMVLLVGAPIVTSRQADRIRNEITEDVEPELFSLIEVQLSVQQTAALARSYALTRNATFRADLDGTIVRLHSQRAEMVAHSRAAGVEDRIRELDAGIGRWLVAVQALAASSAPTTALAETEAASLREDVEQRANETSDYLRGRVAELRNESQDARRLQTLAIALGAGLGAVSMAMIALLAWRGQRLRSRLAAERERFHLLVGAMADGVYECDWRGTLLYMNPAGERLLGISPGAYAGRTEHGLFHHHTPDGEVLTAEQCPILSAARRRQSFDGSDHFFRSDESSFPVIVAASPIETTIGRGTVVLFKDVTEIRAREQAQEDFVAFVSHELRSPLATVLGFASYLERHLDDLGAEENAREAVHAIAADSARMQTIIEVVLDLTRLDTGRFTLKVENLDLASVIDEEIDRAARIHPAANYIRCHSGEPVICRTDDGRIRQVVANLLDNAAKYGGDAPTVQVNVRRVGHQVQVMVKDDGPGIAPEDRPRMFRRFFRGSGEATARSRGTGAGLYISREIVRRMGGDILLQSVPGEGCEFTVTLPAVL